MELYDTYDQWKFIGKWAFSNVLGWIIGHIIGAILFGGVLWLAHDVFSYDVRAPEGIGPFDAIIPLVFIPASTVMLCALGMLHWRTSLKHALHSGKWLWIGTNTLGGAVIGLILASLFSNNSPVAPNAFSGIIGIAGLLGTVIGFSQWFFLRRYIQLASLWILANTGGGIAASALFIMLGQIWKSDLNTIDIVYCCVTPLIFGAITGVVLFSLLQHSKHTPE